MLVKVRSYNKPGILWEQDPQALHRPAEWGGCHAGIKRVLVPRRTMRDVKADVPASVKEAMQILPVDRLDDVLRLAFDPPMLLEPSSRL